MRLSSTKTILLCIAIFFVFIARVSAHNDWDEDCEDDHDHDRDYDQNDKNRNDQPSYPPYGRKPGGTVPYPVGSGYGSTILYPPQATGPAQTVILPPVQPPVRTDIPGLHPPQQNTASGSGLFMSSILLSVIAAITMALMI